MTTITTGRVLVLAVAVIALAFTAPVVSAHGTDTAAEPTPDDAPINGTPGEWADWMESHMSEHMGPGAIGWMESYMGISVEEMAEDMATGDVPGGHMYNGVMRGDDRYNGDVRGGSMYHGDARGGYMHDEVNTPGRYGGMYGHC
ncbi:MAG: hypothetical protein ABEJ58_03220 [Halodesulfurarchaeum sp.]